MKSRGDYDVPGTSLSITFDHARDQYYKGHGLHFHVEDNNGRIASISAITFTKIKGGLPGGKEERALWKWIHENESMLHDDAEYWRENGTH